MIIATEDDLGRVHEMLADFGWLHFAVEDSHRCAWLILESEYGELWATLGSDEVRPWVPALELLKGYGPLKLLQDLAPNPKPPMPQRDSRSDHMERAHADVEPRGIGSTGDDE